MLGANLSVSAITRFYLFIHYVSLFMHILLHISTLGLLGRRGWGPHQPSTSQKHPLKRFGLLTSLLNGRLSADPAALHSCAVVISAESGQPEAF